MPNLKQPNRLDDMAICGLGLWVARQAERLMNPMTHLSKKDVLVAKEALALKVAQLRSFLQYNVPWMLYDELAMHVIQAIHDLLERIKQSHFRGTMAKFVGQMNTAVTMTEVLFTPYLTILSIDTIPKMMRSVFYVKLHMLTGLKYLNLGSLSGGWKTADMEPGIIQSLKNLTCLKYLCINYDCTDDILKCIVLNCPKLERLDLSSSKCITNSSVEIIAKIENLRAVQLYRTSITLEGFTKILLKCPKLEDIGRCDEIGKVLEYIHITNSEAGPFNLTSLVSRYAPANHLQISVEMCPRIRKITVFHNSLQSDLTVLIGLPELMDLKLLNCDFYGDQVKQVLQVKGCNIVSLHLEHVDQIDLNALMYISQMCPVLESLTLYNCTLIQHTSLYTKKLELLPFRNLKHLTWVAVSTEEQILFVLTNCINVKFIHLGTAVQLTDEIVEKILDKNPLIYLEELKIMQSDYLTVSTVERLIQTCMSLKVLVELESWVMLSEGDRDYIKTYISVNNFNVDVSPVRRYFL